MKKKSKILYLLKLLYEETDELHTLNTEEIIKRFEKLGIQTTRKTIASDIECLVEFGIDIIKIRSKQNEYYIGNRDFEEPEIQLLVDAVISSKLITHKKSTALLTKISNLLSRYQAQELIDRVDISAWSKPYNEEIYYNIDKISRAIKNKRNIKFKYKDYNQYKKVILRNKGEFYFLSPFDLIWNDNFYYIIGYEENYSDFSQFRVDRMTEVIITDVEAKERPIDFNAGSYIKSVFKMFSGNSTYITMKCNKEMMKVIIDKYGVEVKTTPINQDEFLTNVEVILGPTFYGWLLQFQGAIQIFEPIYVRHEYQQLLQETLRQLNYERNEELVDD